MSDIRVCDFRKMSGKPKQRTGVLGDALRDSGYRSVNHACRAAGIRSSTVCSILNGHMPLVTASGNVVPDARRFAEVLGETPERLFGYDVFITRIPKGVVQPDEHNGDYRRIVRRVVGTLSDREQMVVRLIFWEENTLVEAGVKCGVGKERIRQVLAKALRRLRHRSRAQYLMDDYIGC